MSSRSGRTPGRGRSWRRIYFRCERRRRPWRGDARSADGKQGLRVDTVERFDTRIAPTKYGFLIEHQHPQQSLASEYVGIGGRTLEKSFTVDGSGPVPQTYANQSAILIYFHGGEVRIHSAQDGRVLGDFQESAERKVIRTDSRSTRTRRAEASSPRSSTRTTFK